MRPRDEDSRRIAVIEDDDGLRGRLLAEFGQSHETKGFASGGAFLLALDGLMPDLVVLDLDLPGFDGLEIAQRVRSHPRFRGVPIVFLTDSLSGDLDMSIGGQPAEVLTKPVDFDRLSLQVERMLCAERSALPA